MYKRQGVSYGALGMSHHSAQDIAAMSAIPNMRVYLPSDRFQTEKLTEALLKDEKPAYIRVGRNAVEDVYEAVSYTHLTEKKYSCDNGTGSYGITISFSDPVIFFRTIVKSPDRLAAL